MKKPKERKPKERKVEEKTFVCWECHKPGFRETELEGHRCKKCRQKRLLLASGSGRHTPWKIEGQRVWERRELGPAAGVRWARRKKVITKEVAAKAVKANEKLPTIKD